MAEIYSKQEQAINQQYKTSSFSHLTKYTYSTNFSSNSRHAPKKEFPLLRSLGHILEAKQLQHPRRSLGLGFDSRTSSLDDVFGCICRRRFYPSTGSRTTTTTPISVQQQLYQSSELLLLLLPSSARESVVWTKISRHEKGRF